MENNKILYQCRTKNRKDLQWLDGRIIKLKEATDFAFELENDENLEKSLKYIQDSNDLEFLKIREF
jgi:hypothetical protein